MLTAVAAFLAALIISCVLVPMVRHVAVRSGLFDHGLTTRKIHARPVPRLGGVAFAAAFYAAFGLVLWADADLAALCVREWRLVVALLGGGLCIAALGLYDDLVGIAARKKLFVQFAVATAAYALGFRIDVLHLPLLGDMALGAFGLPLTVLWIAGVINALNLIDGLDGLAGGVALVAASAFMALALGHDHPLVLVVAAAAGGSVLGFLFFNFNPASIFMGDTGSMFLGFILATTGIRTARETSGAIELLVPIVVLAIPIGDTLLAMARRYCRGMPVFSADRGHIHHRLLAKGFTQRQTALTIYGYSAVVGSVACVLVDASPVDELLCLGVLGTITVVALRWLGFLRLRLVQGLLEDRRRNLVRRTEIGRIARQLQGAAEPAAVWQCLLGAAPALAVDHVALRTHAGTWSSVASRMPKRVARYGLEPERPGADVLELGWDDERVQLDRDTEIAVEQLCAHVRSALARFDGLSANGSTIGLVAGANGVAARGPEVHASGFAAGITAVEPASITRRVG